MIVRTLALFAVTAVAEIAGCYLPYLWLRKAGSPWLLVPGALSLAAFAWLLSLHPSLGAGRTYAAYGGVYVAVALLWMWWIEGAKPDRWDLLGASVALLGMAIIAFAPRGP
jgi:small multidrug resistance family-3 protein